MQLPDSFGTIECLVLEQENVVIVRFKDARLLDEVRIRQCGKELISLVEQYQCSRLLVSFLGVNFVASELLSSSKVSLVVLDKKVKQVSGKLVLSDIIPELYEVFAITRLNKLFTICDREEMAIATHFAPAA
jgi:anti-sigma B factor antagonist